MSSAYFILFFSLFHFHYFIYLNVSGLTIWTLRYVSFKDIFLLHVILYKIKNKNNYVQSKNEKKLKDIQSSS